MICLTCRALDKANSTRFGCSRTCARIIQSTCTWSKNSDGHRSASIGHEILYGYRAAEARVAYFNGVTIPSSRNCPLHLRTMERPSFLPCHRESAVGGTWWFTSFCSRRSNENLQPTSPFPLLMLQMTDDADLQFEYVLFPMNKAELALLLHERKKAMDRGAYTTRMWRNHVRAKERQIEGNRTIHPLIIPTVVVRPLRLPFEKNLPMGFFCLLLCHRHNSVLCGVFTSLLLNQE
jgi:hypothetical protein